MLTRIASLLVMGLLALPAALAEEARIFSAEEMAEIQEADALLRSGDYAGARAVLVAMNETPLSTPEARTEQQKRLGKVLLRLEEFDGAIAALTNAIEYPLSDQTTALTDRCYAYMQLNLMLDAQLDCSRARRDLELARLIGSDDPLERLMQEYRSVSLAMIEASLYRRAGHSRQALDILGEAAAVVEASAADLDRPENRRLRSEDYWPLYLAQAEVMGDLRMEDRAMELLRKLGELMPGRELHRALAVEARLLSNSGDIDGAVHTWTRAAETLDTEGMSGRSAARQTHEYLFLACTTLLRAQRYEEALDYCSSAATADRTDGYYAEAHAIALLRSRGWQDAWPEAVRARRLQTETPIAALTLSEFLAAAKDRRPERILPLDFDTRPSGMVRQAFQFLGATR